MTIQHLKKPIKLFFKDYFNKPTIIFETIDTAPFITKLIVKLIDQLVTKKIMFGQPIALPNKLKRAKFNFYYILAFFQDIDNIFIKAFSLIIT